jgi:hypothetical protein
MSTKASLILQTLNESNRFKLKDYGFSECPTLTDVSGKAVLVAGLKKYTGDTEDYIEFHHPGLPEGDAETFTSVSAAMDAAKKLNYKFDLKSVSEFTKFLKENSTFKD